MKTYSTGGLRAGFGRRDITPLEPCFLVGYPHAERTSTGVHDPLFASVLCLENDRSPVVLVSLDVLFVTADWTRECREVISGQTGIPPEAILIGATHTHSGPHTAEILAWRDDPVVPPVNPNYLAFLRERTADAVLEAWQSCRPAEGAWVTADVRGLAGGNRLDPRGVEDPEAGLLLVRSEQGRPLAVLSIYGMHPTVLHEDSTLFSSDFIAFTRQTIETAFPGAGVVYLNGACGNQSPRRAVTAQTFAEAARIGRAVGEKMVEALRGNRQFTREFPIGHATRALRLEGKRFPSWPEAGANLARARAHYERLRVKGAPAGAVRTAECTVFGAEEVLTLAKAEQSGEAEALREKYRSQEIQILRLGERIVAAWPGEFFAEYGLEIKRRAGRRSFVVTMANGELQGYVVTPEAEAAGGYEAQMSLFPASAGAAFVEATVSMIGEIT
jgi:hypothetical protein